MQKYSYLFPDKFDWTIFPAKSVVVDVGGGMGTVLMDLFKQNQSLEYVLQDLPGTIAQAKEVRCKYCTSLQVYDDTLQHWKAIMPQALESGSVTMQGADNESCRHRRITEPVLVT